MSKTQTKSVQIVNTTDEEVDKVKSLTTEKEAEVSQTETAEILGGNEAETAFLEHVVFGKKEYFVSSLKKATKNLDEKLEESESENDEAPEEINIERSAKKLQPVWIDEDDEKEVILPRKRKNVQVHRANDKLDAISGQEYQSRLRENFEKISGPEPKWAKIGGEKSKRKKFHSDSSASESENEDETEKKEKIDEFFQSTSEFLRRPEFLEKGQLDLKKLKDVSFGHREKFTAMKNLEFHPEARIFLAAGDQTQRLLLFQIDGKENPLLESLVFERFPIDTAHFHPGTQRVVVGSRLHPHFFYFDMMANEIVKVPWNRAMQQRRMDKFSISPDGNLLAFHGQYGYIHLLSGKSYEWIHSMKMNGELAALSFSADGQKLFSFGDEGKVYVWDCGTRQLEHQFFDEGCVKGTAIDAEKNFRFIACGSNSGVVNVYEMNSVMNSQNPRPLKSVMNLTTSCSGLKFNGTGEILAMFSEFKENSVRLLHLRSQTVFDNFPAKRERMLRIRSAAFSPNSGYFSLGNNNGEAQLYRLKHFKDY